MGVTTFTHKVGTFVCLNEKKEEEVNNNVLLLNKYPYGVVIAGAKRLPSFRYRREKDVWDGTMVYIYMEQEFRECEPDTSRKESSGQRMNNGQATSLCGKKI